MSASCGKVGAICYSFGLLCAGCTLLEERKVTCAHNIICEVVNAGADFQFGDDCINGKVIDGDLITSKYPLFGYQLLDVFLKEIETQ